MKRDLLPASLALTLVLVVGSILVAVQLILGPGSGSVNVDRKYTETVEVRSEALKTEVLVNGVEREDCVFYKADSTVVCRDRPLHPAGQKPNP